MYKKNYSSIVIYFLGSLLTVYLTLKFNKLIKKDKKKELLFIACICLIIFGINTYTSYYDPVKDFRTEANEYQYVELNARVLLTSALAVGVFYRFMGIKKEDQYAIKLPIILSFIFSSLVLVLIWMPKVSGKYIRMLRDVKTVFLIESIYCMIVSMMNILHYSS
jgi:hypothetical protein